MWVPNEIDDELVSFLASNDQPSFGQWVLDTENTTTKTETRTRELTKDEIVPCPTVPETTQPPATTTSPPTSPPTTAVEAQSQPPAAASTTTTQPPAAAPAAGLPSTGSSPVAMVLIALVTLLGGTVLVRLGRRSTD